MAELVNQDDSMSYVDIDDSKDAILDGHFNLDKIAEVIMKEFEND